MTVSRLSRDGIAYVVPGSAVRLRRALAAVGLPRAETLLHVPDVIRTRYLVPVGTAAERYALTGGIAMSRWKQVLASGLGSRGRALLGPTGAIHRRDPATQLAAWLFGLGGKERPTGSTIVALPHGTKEGAVLYRFAGDGARPDALAKLTPGAGYELEALQQIAPPAGDAGVRIPVVLASGQLDSVPLVLESVVSGRAAADLVARGRIGTHELQERIAIWLERWNRSCARLRPIGRDDIERFVLGPASRAAMDDSYLEFLRTLGARSLGRSCAFVPSHGDLTLANVLVDDQGGLGVVDWEHATAESLPLMDLLYAGVDAVAALHRYADRPGAFRTCFTTNGGHALSLERLRHRSSTHLELDEIVQTLCFHACWLHHAANEADRSTDSTQGPFVMILNTIASTPELFDVQHGP